MSNIIIVTRPPTLPDQDLSPGPLTLDTSAHQTKLWRPNHKAQSQSSRQYHCQTIECNHNRHVNTAA